MIAMTRRVRIEILVDAPLAERVAAISEKVGIKGYTLMRTVSGSGTRGAWREDLISGATAKLIFLAIAAPEAADAFVEALAPLLESHGLIVLKSDVEVVRPEKF